MSELSEAFARYVLDPAEIDALRTALDDAGLSTAATLLRESDSQRAGVRVVDGSAVGPAWTGRTCWVGATPPGDAEPGSLWFDAADTAVMLLVSRPADEFASWPEAVQQRMTPLVGWVSLEPMAGWQVAGWALASGAAVAVDDGLAAATGLSGQEALRCSRFFGKSLAGRVGWAAIAHLGETTAAELWPVDGGPELMGYVGEGQVLVLDRLSAVRPDDEDDEDDEHDDGDDTGDAGRAAPEPGRYEETEELTGVAFRTAVSSQRGLDTGSPWPRRR